MKFFRSSLGRWFVCLVLVAGIFTFRPQPAQAFVNAFQLVSILKSVPQDIKETKDTIWSSIVKSAKYTFSSSLRAVVNKLAYDTATWIGSGSAGQKPLYEQEEWTNWGRQVRDAAVGNFIENFSKTDGGSFIKEYGICAPSFALQVKISLGLADMSSQSRGLTESRCNLAQIWRNTNALFPQKIDGDYLAKLSTYVLDPRMNDLGIAWEAFNKKDSVTSAQIYGEEQQRKENDGWLNVRSIASGKIIAPPGTPLLALQSAKDLQNAGFFDRTGDIFVDAANIFLNQLALTAFNKMIASLNKTGSSLDVGNYYGQGATGGVTEVQRRNSTILQAKFTERADYNVLSQLTTCNDESAPGPTNCVIDQPFAQAIGGRLTIAEAIDKKLLDGNARVGYNRNGDDLSYKDGYPYRSLIILRKYRVLPVGWEIAAQYMGRHSEETKQVTLNDLIACYSDTDITYPGYSESWCRGLVDPNWVLKLPQMFCGMEGYGPELIQANPFKTVDENNVEKTEVQVTRNDNYCADEQSCIKEGANGACEQYGYCTEEKREWSFGDESNSCEARNNTCQTFKSDSGQSVSYLENTLNFSECDANQVGCKRYATSGRASYDAAAKKVTVAWSGDTGLRYFNKNIQQCDASGEGCHEFIRAGDDLLTNLVSDGSFEQSTCSGGGTPDAPGAEPINGCQTASISSPGGLLPAPNDNWYVSANGNVQAGITQDQTIDGKQSFYINGNGGLYSRDNGTPTILPKNFTFQPDTYYTLSASVYINSGKVSIGFGGTKGLTKEITTTGSWQRETVVFYNPSDSDTHDFFIRASGGSASFYIDGVQLVTGRSLADYTEYGLTNVIYEKLLPAYLEPLCYVGGRGETSEYLLKDNAPAECYRFARKCSSDEVGCQSYTSELTGIQVTAKAKAKDACPESCVGYDIFVQQANAFYPKQPAYFIPNTARSCSAQAVGCTAFTNLDAAGSGGEAVEYYSDMRRCLKPDANSCGQFYTWEGSDDSGYQIRVYSLNKVSNGTSEEPKSTLSSSDEARLCNADVFKRLPTEAGYNYDCRQFYASDGSVSYHLYSKTITCSENCHPYRREGMNQDSCGANGGDWDNNRCLYYAIPGEGSSCTAEQVGCQEYTGNIANNTQVVLNDSFETVATPTDGWSGGTSSSTSLSIGGRSLKGSSFSKIVGEDVERNVSYNISFLAKAAGQNTTMNSINLVNQSGERAEFAVGAQLIKTDWQPYSFNLESLNHDVTAASGNVGEQLKMIFSGEVYIDNIKLTAIPDRYYLINDSWTTPEECDQDFAGNSAGGYMLGCSRYKKADDTTVTLRSFSSLCDDSAAGCEQMIDTANSLATARKALVNDTNNNGSCDVEERECIETAADSLVNVVYDKSKLCGSDTKGCQRMALTSVYNGGAPTFSDVFIKNDPDVYAQAVCKASGVGCSQWNIASDNSTVYFKDPGNEACEWRLQAGTSNLYKWFKKGTNDECPVSADKTVGPGGAGNRVLQPSQWAGVCDAAQSGCTEYIDPLSRSSDNLILNPSYKKMSSTSDVADNWTKSSPSSSEAYQKLTLNPQTIYILKDAVPATRSRDVGGTTRVKISCEGRSLQVLDENNNFQTKNQIDYGTVGDSSTQFYIPLTDSYAPVSCTVTRTNAVPAYYDVDTVSLRQAITAYQLSQNLDRSSHNNLVNFEKGAVLFNERSQSGAGKAKLIYNADATYDTTLDGASPSTRGPRNANVLLKVQPDRTCSRWLDCLTYIPDPSNPGKKICLDIGECEAFASDGSCAARVPAERRNQNQLNTPFGNLSGYSKVGYSDNGESLTDYYRLSAMSQVGTPVALAGSSNPIQGFEGDSTVIGVGGDGWTTNGGSIINGAYAASKSPVQSLYKLPKQGYTGFMAPEGTNYAKINPSSYLSSGAVTLTPNQRYVLSFYSYTGGGTLSVKLTGSNRDNDPTILVIDAKDQPNQWVRRTVGFKATGSSQKIIFENGSGAAYLDDIRIDTSLNVRCSNSAADPNNCINPTNTTSGNRPQYISPTCRLFPTENALACSYTDDNKITTQGIKGYCLENDPRNPAACLLWYPVSRIASDTAEEGGEINFEGKSVYYCLDTQDRCLDNQKPQLFCSKFLKVDTDYYWASRLASDSNFTLPKMGGATELGYFYPHDSSNPPTYTRHIDLGGEAGPIFYISELTSKTAGSYFGAFVRDNALDNPQAVTYSASNGGNPGLNSFVPYYGTDGQNRCSADGVNVIPPFYNASDSVFYGHVEGSGHTSHPSLGTWDVCGVAHAGRVDFREGGSNSCSGEDCKYRHVEEVFSVNDCAPGTNTCTTSGVSCSVNGNNRQWTGNVSDTEADSDDPACVFYCYNTIKDIKVTSPEPIGGSGDKYTNAISVIRRLFPGLSNWSLYNWQGNTYSAPQVFSHPSMPPCNNTGLAPRPSVTGTSDDDYCFINPLISNFRINGSASGPVIVNGSEYVTFSFNTKTDAEQLPIRKILLDFGYKDEANDPVVYDSGRVNYTDVNPRYLVKKIDFSEIASGNNIPITSSNGCSQSSPCFKIRPKLSITDNWGKTAQLLSDIEIIVKNKAN